MAFIDDRDLKPDRPDAPQVVYVQAPRNRWLPLLVVLNIVALVVIVGFVVGPKLDWDFLSSGDDDGQVSISDLDPELLMTPSGRHLQCVVLNGNIFELTRVAWSQNPNARTVTITVPGKPTRQGLFRIGETFADGKIRIADIGRTNVTLEANGDTQTFTIAGEPAAATGDVPPSGLTMIPAKDNGVLSDVPTGRVKTPTTPKPETTEPETTDPEIADDVKTIDDLPDLRDIPLRRDDYQTMVKELPDLFEKDFVFHTAFEPETMVPYGLQIKKLKVDSRFYAHGMKPGDVLLTVNETDVYRIPDLDIAVRSNSFRDELRLIVWRDESVIEFVFHPGVPND